MPGRTCSPPAGTRRTSDRPGGVPSAHQTGAAAPPRPRAAPGSAPRARSSPAPPGGRVCRGVGFASGAFELPLECRHCTFIERRACLLESAGERLFLGLPVRARGPEGGLGRLELALAAVTVREVARPRPVAVYQALYLTLRQLARGGLRDQIQVALRPEEEPRDDREQAGDDVAPTPEICRVRVGDEARAGGDHRADDRYRAQNKVPTAKALEVAAVREGELPRVQQPGLLGPVEADDRGLLARRHRQTLGDAVGDMVRILAQGVEDQPRRVVHVRGHRERRELLVAVVLRLRASTIAWHIWSTQNPEERSRTSWPPPCARSMDLSKALSLPHMTAVACGRRRHRYLEKAILSASCRKKIMCVQYGESSAANT